MSASRGAVCQRLFAFLCAVDRWVEVLGSLGEIWGDWGKSGGAVGVGVALVVFI